MTDEETTKKVVDDLCKILIPVLMRMLTDEKKPDLTINVNDKEFLIMRLK